MPGEDFHLSDQVRPQAHWVAAARRDPEHRRQLGPRSRSADSAMGEFPGAVGPPAPTAIPQ